MAASLNDRAYAIVRNELATSLVNLGVKLLPGLQDGPAIYDFSGSRSDEAGLLLTRVCMSGLATVSRTSGPLLGRPDYPFLEVATDQVTDSAIRSQVAGYQRQIGDGLWFVSGPVRTCFPSDAYARDYGPIDTESEFVVAVLEGSMPPDELLAKLAEKSGKSLSQLVVLFGPTASWPTTLQVLGRVVETLVKRMIDLNISGFHPNAITRAVGRIPICPVPKDDDDGMSMANEAGIYGGEVTLDLNLDTQVLAEMLPLLPSSAAPELYGLPFAQIMAAASEGGGFDFGRIKHVFAPAKVVIRNERDGSTHTVGAIDESQLRRAFRFT